MHLAGHLFFLFSFKKKIITNISYLTGFLEISQCGGSCLGSGSWDFSPSSMGAVVIWRLDWGRRSRVQAHSSGCRLETPVPHHMALCIGLLMMRLPPEWGKQDRESKWDGNHNERYIFFFFLRQLIPLLNSSICWENCLLTILFCILALASGGQPGSLFIHRV